MSEINRMFTPAEIRRMLNLTLEELAKKLGVSHMTLQRREKGESAWKATEIKILAELSGIPIDRIQY